MNATAPWRHESFSRAWLRRSVTIPVYLVLALVLMALSPVLLLLTGITDLARPRRFALSRALILAEIYFLAEFIGILVSFFLWVRFAGWRSSATPGYLAANFALQRRWAAAIFAGARWTFGLRVSVEGDHALQPGPVIVLGRHASPLDNLIPAVVASGWHRLRLRWVINRWLLRDPCLDIVGNRLPNVFVDASNEEPRGQAVRVGALGAGLGHDEGVLIFPEGALFSASRLRRLIDRLTEAGAAEADRASRLRAVLPPRSGAFLSALAAAPAADVAIFEHRGLDVARGYRALLSGDLAGSSVSIRVRRIPRREIPDDPAGQTDWLWAQWELLDSWVRRETAAANRSASASEEHCVPD